jgi:flagellar assembly factor FliW
MTAVETAIGTPHLTFETGLPGFPEAHTFVLLQTDLAREPFSIMRCIEDESLEFVVAPPHLFFPDYAPEVDDSISNRINLEDAADALVLVTLTVGDDAADITANLLGPIIVNRHTNKAVQAVLANQGYDLRVPIFDSKLIAESESSSEEG